MLLKELKELLESPIPTISLQKAHDLNLFGPVYHGTSETSRENIKVHGFKVVDDSQIELKAHGYPISNYALGIPAPIHHLGYGVYFTTIKNIAKSFNQNSTKGLLQYYLKLNSIEEINFASQAKMMNWWISNGYDFNWDNIKGEKSFSNVAEIEKERIRATKNMTNQLSQKYDAVWFKGKGITRLLDGDQICIFNPTGKIYQLDKTPQPGKEFGSQVRIKDVETVYDITLRRIQQFRPEIKELPIDDFDVNFLNIGNIIYVPKNPKNTATIVQKNNDRFVLKFKKGGTKYNYSQDMLEELA